MVTVRATPLYTEYVLNLANEEIQHQLPSNCLIQSESGELIFVPGHAQPPTALMKAVAGAVAEHLQFVKS